MTIFANDQIQTGADTVAYIMLPGRILTLDRKSSAVFRDGTLVVNRGRAWRSDGLTAAGRGGTQARLAAPPSVKASGTAGTANVAFADDERNDHFSGICAQFSQACDQAENTCEQRYHRECVCHYVSDHDQDDVSPIQPDADDFKMLPGQETVAEEDRIRARAKHEVLASSCTKGRAKVISAGRSRAKADPAAENREND